MENYSYFSFNNIPCILIEKDDKIRLIPCKEDELKYLFKYIQATNFDIDYSSGVYKYSHAYIHRIIQWHEYIDLVPDYIINSISSKFCSMELTGPAIDDFFSPSIYFFYKYKKGKNFGDVVYKDDIADAWNIDFEGSNLKITLYYGSVLRRGIESDLMLHPKLKIEFAETTDHNYIYRIYNSIKRFLSFILYRSECGEFDIELFGMIDDHFSSVGRMFDTKQTNLKYQKQTGRICYSDYKKYVPQILQFVFNDSSLYLKHLPEHGIRDWDRDDVELIYTRLFAAFENECQKKKELYEKADTSKIQGIKKQLIDSIDDINGEKNCFTEDENQFINDVKQRILQLGTQFGQTLKIVNAYNILADSIDRLIHEILYRHTEYRSVTKLTTKQIKSIARSLTKLRGAIVHGGEYNKISDEDYQIIEFFEVMIYAQMLYRAEIDFSDIKMIVGTTLLHHFDLFDKSMEEIYNNEETSE